MGGPSLSPVGVKAICVMARYLQLLLNHVGLAVKWLILPAHVAMMAAILADNCQQNCRPLDSGRHKPAASDASGHVVGRLRYVVSRHAQLSAML